MRNSCGNKISGPINLGNSSVGGCYGCGGNMQGELGLGHNQRVDKPMLLPWTSNIAGSFKQIAAGNQWHTYLTSNGELYIAGNNSSGQFGLNNTQNIKTAQLHEEYKKKGPIKMIASGTYADHNVVLMGMYKTAKYLYLSYHRQQTQPIKLRNTHSVFVIYYIQKVVIYILMELVIIHN